MDGIDTVVVVVGHGNLGQVLIEATGHTTHHLGVDVEIVLDQSTEIRECPAEA